MSLWRHYLLDEHRRKPFTAKLLPTAEEVHFTHDLLVNTLRLGVHSYVGWNASDEGHEFVFLSLFLGLHTHTNMPSWVIPRWHKCPLQHRKAKLSIFSMICLEENILCFEAIHLKEFLGVVESEHVVVVFDVVLVQKSINLLRKASAEPSQRSKFKS